MKYDATVIGEIYLDHVFSGFACWPKPGEEVFTDAYAYELGGGAVTTACALAKLGRKVQLIGVVGQSQAAEIGRRLAEFGVSAENLLTSTRRSGITVSISTKQDRTFFSYRGANEELGKHLLGDSTLLLRAAAARHVHLAFPITIDQADHAIPMLREFGAATTLDVGHQLSWLTGAVAPHILRAVDYFLPNEKEAALLGGSANGYLSYCQELGLRNAVVKLGSAGAVLTEDGIEYRAAAPDVEVLDTTGAGDAFDAGFIDGLLLGASPQQCLEFGCICGALSTRGVGALDALPSREEVELAYEGNDAA